MGKLPTTILRRPSAALASSPRSANASALSSRPPPTRQQTRHATFIPRERRPYAFTQLVQLSDGSTFTMRTTSPASMYRSVKDSRNHVLWQPSDKSLRNVEVDAAGKLAAFRERFGRSWDLTSARPEEKEEDVGKDTRTAGATATPAVDGIQQRTDEEEADSMEDLITQYASQAGLNFQGKSAKDQARADRMKKKK
ncbi:hypothetical protein P8C59_003974 [Phyllachora maydis]|uniref:Ribosomal protein bL31m N-terminal domain-containing protein n=1 Tax=Phyllachora maydis TaxID=1825666 RepID=A0AAD9I1S6_9PEZI|nr:hypothetical protein P8C59_003974 [Phyllachora maydis]